MTMLSVLQPGPNSTLETIRRCLASKFSTHLDVAVAYITSSGLRTLIQVFEDELGNDLDGISIRWLTSFDYKRTDPAALSRILELQDERVRIHQGQSILSKDCIPSTPFHPKVFIFRGDAEQRVLAGSGNLSYSGLVRGHEAGFLATNADGNAPIAASVNSYLKWYEGLYHAGDNLNESLFSRYKEQYDKRENLEAPTLTDDDFLPLSQSRTALSLIDLRKIRASRRMWISAGNITKNRGVNLPGNQLMMKRMTRVFFGIPAIDVPVDSLLGRFGIAYENDEYKECTLSYSNNNMDKLTLPIPNNGGPTTYDQSTILLERVQPSKFQLTLAGPGDRKRWKSKSNSIDGHFEMNGGREWGVF
jgi:HKD family nuclease